MPKAARPRSTRTRADPIATHREPSGLRASTRMSTRRSVDAAGQRSRPAVKQEPINATTAPVKRRDSSIEQPMKKEEPVSDEQESRPTVPVKREDAVALPMEGRVREESRPTTQVKREGSVRASEEQKALKQEDSDSGPVKEEDPSTVPVKREGSVRPSEEREQSPGSDEENIPPLKPEHPMTPESEEVKQELAGPEDEHVESYLLLVRLRFVTDPTIHRLLCVPSNLTFDRFHSVLRKAFGWADVHLHAFHVLDITGTLPNPVMDGLPVEVFTLSTPDPDWDYDMDGDNRDEGGYTLADIYDSDEFRGKVKIQYEYDFGDGWEHDIQFLGKADPAMKRAMRVPEHVQVFCISGEVRHYFPIRTGAWNVLTRIRGPSMCRGLRRNSWLGGAQGSL
ncbi:putative protein y4hQ [Diplodia seriata]|uniref:Plasmid pRiA4b Orf3-like domain-containing protein n=1 Tax=Diplodia seriata TaxID=420778 RepID=A0A1S8B2G0_9PEZI|nr:putative protein y4hQ [Diplodia seriata]